MTTPPIWFDRAGQPITAMQAEQYLRDPFYVIVRQTLLVPFAVSTTWLAANFANPLSGCELLLFESVVVLDPRKRAEVIRQHGAEAVEGLVGLYTRDSTEAEAIATHGQFVGAVQAWLRERGLTSTVDEWPALSAARAGRYAVRDDRAPCVDRQGHPLDIETHQRLRADRGYRIVVQTELERHVVSTAWEGINLAVDGQPPRQQFHTDVFELEPFRSGQIELAYEHMPLNERSATEGEAFEAHERVVQAVRAAEAAGQ